MKYRVYGLILAAVVLAAGAFPAQAQEPITIERLQIDIWPEYDQPSLLVIYHLTLAAETQLPANISLRIPARAGAPYNLAFQNVDGMLLNLEYSTQTQGDWLVLNFVALSSVLQIEYYDPSLVIQNDLHSFDYTWPADVRVRNLTVSLQQPRSATQMTTSMAGANQQTGTDNLQYFIADYGLVDSGKPLNIHVTYQKTDNALSVSAAPVAPIQPTGSTNTNALPTASSGSSNTPWVILLAVAVLLAAGSLFWYFLQQRRQTQTASLRHRHTPGRSPSLDEIGFDDTEGTLYCPQCGRRAASGDLFCRTCGTSMRK